MTRVHAAALLTLFFAVFAEDYFKIQLHGHPDVWPVYMVDWVSRLGLLLVIFGLPFFKDFLHTASQTFAAAPRRYHFHELMLPGLGFAVLLVFFLGPIIEIYIGRVVYEHVPGWVLFGYPRIKDGVLLGLDLSLGLFLVGFTEELIFRRMAANYMERLDFSKPLIILISSVVFSSIHWMGGAAAFGDYVRLRGDLHGDLPPPAQFLAGGVSALLHQRGLFLQQKPVRTISRHARCRLSGKRARLSPCVWLPRGRP